MIQNILFDLDNTLFDFDRAEALAVRRTLQDLGIDPTPALVTRYSQLTLAQWKLLELGQLTRQEVKLRRYQLLFEEFGIERNPREAALIYETKLGIGHYFVDGAEELLKKLYPDYQLYLVTNGTASVQRSRLQSSGIRPFFQEIFISEDLGADKPSAAYFDACFARIPNFQKGKTVIVGDSLTSDIKGGLNAGIRTIWFNSARTANETEIKPDYEINSLRDLPELLKNL